MDKLLIIFVYKFLVDQLFYASHNLTLNYDNLN